MRLTKLDRLLLEEMCVAAIQQLGRMLRRGPIDRVYETVKDVPGCRVRIIVEPIQGGS